MNWLLAVAEKEQEQGWRKPSGLQFNFPCLGCGGAHPPDSPSVWLRYDGWEFSAPFKCMCCGRVICIRQFAFGRACGSCDMGACDPHNRSYRLGATHEHPAWWLGYGHSREETIAAFAEQSGIGARRSPTTGKATG